MTAEISDVMEARAHTGGPPFAPKKILENPSQLHEMPHMFLEKACPTRESIYIIYITLEGILRRFENIVLSPERHQENFCG